MANRISESTLLDNKHELEINYFLSGFVLIIFYEMFDHYCDLEQKFNKKFKRIQNPAGETSFGFYLFHKNESVGKKRDKRVAFNCSKEIVFLGIHILTKGPPIIVLELYIWNPVMIGILCP